MLSEGVRYRELRLASQDLHPRKAEGAAEDGLDGWAFMMRSADGQLALLYFEDAAARGAASGLRPSARYRWTWFDPREGRWLRPSSLRADSSGVVRVPRFPTGGPRAGEDWAAKLVQVP